MFSVSPLFSNDCVLQRGTIITIFGEGSDGLEVQAVLKNKDGCITGKNKTFARNGRWRLCLEEQRAMTGATLVVSCKESKRVFYNVAVGEVWLAGGQSNMEFELGNSTEGPIELENEASPNVRFFYTKKNSWMDKKFYEDERYNSWQVWGSESAHTWSAVGYFFAKKLARDLGVTVGIIGCNKGGTSASCWLSREALSEDTGLSSYLDEYEAAVGNKSEEEQIKEFDAYEKEQAAWDKKYADLQKENPGVTWEQAEKQIGKNPWPGPMGIKNPHKPSALYESMVARTAPYTIRGVLFYQGESDDHKPLLYYRLFSKLISCWRKLWGDDTLPFVFVQLPMHRYEGDEDFRNWCLIREAQEKIASTVRNTTLASALDQGQYNDIHPKTKKILGERMEVSALDLVYRQIRKEEAVSPSLKSFFAEDDRITLTFDNAMEGFFFKKDEEELTHYIHLESLVGRQVPESFSGFEIAGPDGVYHPAKVEEVEGRTDKLVLTSDKVNVAVSARYAWYNYGPVTVFGKNGMPLLPFRTDKDEAGAAGHAGIKQVMTV
ncbi:MAG: hypothetical protein IJL80_11440 [Treponema sp.]|nr:hypothetical protein [Treponema sp.]